MYLPFTLHLIYAQWAILAAEHGRTRSHTVAHDWTRSHTVEHGHTDKNVSSKCPIVCALTHTRTPSGQNL